MKYICTIILLCFSWIVLLGEEKPAIGSGNINESAEKRRRSPGNGSIDKADPEYQDSLWLNLEYVNYDMIFVGLPTVY